MPQSRINWERIVTIVTLIGFVATTVGWVHTSGKAKGKREAFEESVNKDLEDIKILLTLQTEYNEKQTDFNAEYRTHVSSIKEQLEHIRERLNSQH